MKTIVFAIAGLCMVIGITTYLTRPSPQPGTATKPLTVPTTAAENERAPKAEISEIRERSANIEPSANGIRPQPPAANSRNGTAVTQSLPFHQALNALISKESGFLQKQSAWQEIKDAGKLDPLIAELEKRATAEPGAPEYPATLGQAYLQKAGTLKDVREQGILGMKADQTFDAALELDPANWEAGFWKATAMSYWPPQLGKGPEVIQRFVDLMKLQEGQPTQPEFVQTYLLLGDQYQKQGYPEYARQVWQRGVALFPNEPKLGEKLSQAQAETQQAAAR